MRGGGGDAGASLRVRRRNLNVRARLRGMLSPSMGNRRAWERCLPPINAGLSNGEKRRKYKLGGWW